MLLCFLVSLVSGALAMQNGDLRLVNGPSPNIGRVEVYYAGEWGTVCDDSFHQRDADVICRQLGFEGADKFVYRAGFGQGSGRIWIDQLSCTGQEQSVIECRHNGWGINDCSHSEDAGVHCSRRVPDDRPKTLPVRLSCPEHTEGGSCKQCPTKTHPNKTDCLPTTAVEGVVEVFYKGVWRPVSANDWDAKDARVVCGELGYPLHSATLPTLQELWPNWDDDSPCDVGSGGRIQCDPITFVENSAFRGRLRATFLQAVDCTGKESKLLDCYFPSLGPHGNPSRRVATARCLLAPHRDCYDSTADVLNYRLRAGAVPWMGRVEVKLNDKWGTVCDYGWAITAGSVLCRSLGYGTAKEINYRASFGRGVGPIHLTLVECEGDEVNIGSCSHRGGSSATVCGHQGDAGVVCNAPQKCELPDKTRFHEVVEAHNPSFPNRFLEVKGFLGWGLFCKGSLSLRTAEVICREHRQEFVVRIRQSTVKDYIGTSYLGSIECTGDEESTDNCKVTIAPTAKCTSGHIAIDCSRAVPDLVPDLLAFERSLRYYRYVDRLPMYYLTCAREENCLSSSATGLSPNDLRHLLRFDSQTMNYGTIDFLPNLQPHEWLWHKCHAHYHSFEAFIHYDILDETTEEKVAEGHKASFCLEDSFCDRGTYPRYRCGTGIQGISVNCGDVYGRHLDCQWIDITDVVPGTYIVRQIVNPNRLVPESDYSNNMIQCTLRYYPGFYLDVHSCVHSDH